MIRKLDRESFMIAKLLSAHSTAYFALKCFNIETSMVKDSCHDSNIALLKLSYWKDSLKNRTNHSYLKFIPPSILIDKWLERIIQQRTQQLNTAFSSLADVEQSGENIYASQHYIMLQLSEHSSIENEHYASHLAKCHSLTTLVRSVAPLLKLGKFEYPLEMLASQSISQHSIITRPENHLRELQELTFELWKYAKVHLDICSNYRKLPIYLQLCKLIQDERMRVIEKANFNAFDYRLFYNRSIRLPIKMYLIAKASNVFQ